MKSVLMNAIVLSALCGCAREPALPEVRAGEWTGAARCGDISFTVNAAGVEGVNIHELPDFLKQRWPAIREQLLSGAYEPRPVKRHIGAGRKAKTGILAGFCLVASGELDERSYSECD